MPPVMEKKEAQEVTINCESAQGVWINPKDLGRGEGPAVLVENGNTVTLPKSLAALLVQNQQALAGKVELKKKASK